MDTEKMNQTSNGADQGPKAGQPKPILDQMTDLASANFFRSHRTACSGLPMPCSRPGP
jgi:hypothetical protein